MSIASEISRISGNVADAYTAANAKGATMPVSQNSDNLATTISTIPSGITPTGTKSITANGVYDVTDFASADVQVPTTAPAHYVEKTVDANGKLNNSANIINLNGVTDVGTGALAYAYYTTAFPDGTSVDLSDLTTLSSSYACQNMFNVCGGITSVNLSGLTTISGSGACQNMLSGCPRLTSVDLSSLTTISGSSACQSMLSGCSRLTSVDLSSLTTISGSNACGGMFQYCSELINVDLSGLTTISGNYACSNMFANCTGLTSVDLSSLTDIISDGACSNMFANCTGLTSVDLSNLTTATNGSCQSMFAVCSSLLGIYLPKITSPDYTSRQSIFTNFFGAKNVNLEVLDLRNLRTVGNYGILDNMAAYTTKLTMVNLNAIEHIGTEAARAFLYGTSATSSLSDIYFPMLTSFGTNPFYTNCFSSRQNLTIHFRKDVQATVEALANYATLWGAGTGSSVVFDLAGTLTGADSNSYARSEKDSVYASETAGAAKTATAWSYNDTIYYTSGGAEPSIGDIIYSDAACTTAVTTISSIA